MRDLLSRDFDSFNAEVMDGALLEGRREQEGLESERRVVGVVLLKREVSAWLAVGAHRTIASAGVVRCTAPACVCAVALCLPESVSSFTIPLTIGPPETDAHIPLGRSSSNPSARQLLCIPISPLNLWNPPQVPRYCIPDTLKC